MPPLGLYIHVPFCKSKCGYCDFYSLSDCRALKSYAAALCNEIRTRLPDALAGRKLSTVYFGGGTPSLLSADDFHLIFSEIAAFSEIAEWMAEVDEITFEANPDDLSDEYLDSLKGLPFNRISIGIQSFNDTELKFINRRHTASEAIEAVKRCRAHGFNNISIDLMYGLPLQTVESWKYSVEQAVALGVEHISAYMLGLEEHVPLYRSLKSGLWKETDDETAEVMYRYLSERLEQAGFEHYEISNFARPGMRSRHNSSYWKGVPYVGLGPGAHSYDADRQCRSWNAPDVAGYVGHYITGASDGRFKDGCGYEMLTDEDIYNEYVMTHLRTIDGVDLSEMRRLFKPKYLLHFEQCMVLQNPDSLMTDGDRVCINPDYWFVSDEIIRELLFLSD